MRRGQHDYFDETSVVVATSSLYTNGRASAKIPCGSNSLLGFGETTRLQRSTTYNRSTEDGTQYKRALSGRGLAEFKLQQQ